MPWWVCFLVAWVVISVPFSLLMGAVLAYGMGTKQRREREQRQVVYDIFDGKAVR